MRSSEIARQYIRELLRGWKFDRRFWWSSGSECLGKAHNDFMQMKLID